MNEARTDLLTRFAALEKSAEARAWAEVVTDAELRRAVEALESARRDTRRDGFLAGDWTDDPKFIDVTDEYRQ